MFIQTEATPNPEVLKFLPGRDVTGAGTREYRSASEARPSPLAAAIFEIDGVVRIPETHEPGSFVKLTVTAAEGPDLDAA